MAENAQWHVVHSDGRHADKAIKAMEDELHFEVYYPKMRVFRPARSNQVTASQRKQRCMVGKPVMLPLFLGYIFVLFDLASPRWHELFDLFGVHGIVLNGGLPALVRTEIVDGIKSLEVGGAIPIETPLKRLFFAVGQHVRISEGPFIGFEGNVNDLDEAHQKVLLNILVFGSVRSVQFDATHVIAN